MNAALPHADPSNQAQSPRTSRLLTTLLVLPAATVLLSPFGMVAVAAAAQPEMLNVLADKPLAAAQLTGGLFISLLFCLLPFSKWATVPVRASGNTARDEG
ncbi:MAG: hypothetical protein WBB38_12840 [Hyphomicrobiaceae bacterium]|jgi:hypothetical protein